MCLCACVCMCMYSVCVCVFDSIFTLYMLIIHYLVNRLRPTHVHVSHNNILIILYLHDIIIMQMTTQACMHTHKQESKQESKLTHTHTHTS